MKQSNAEKEDDEFGLEYQIFIMQRMIGQLPTDIRTLLQSQLDTIVQAINQRFDIIKNSISEDLDDARLSILNMQFDLDATRIERDKLKNASQ